MNAPSIGIDFGTTTSSMAWVDPRTGKAEVLKNAEGEEKTPSVVYFGDGAPLVGTAAEQMLEDEDERRRVVASIKRELVNAPTLALPGRRVTAVEVAAVVLAKLKHDAEALYFRAPVTRAVITRPAAFYAMERDEIAQAARLAGFAEVALLDEPVAAALAYSRDGLDVGRHVLVYDLGGGTFDLALLRATDGGFELALEPKGLRRCGGDDFDEALYDHCDAEAVRQWGEPLDGTGRDLHFLRACRQRKESLSAHDQALFSSLVGGGRVFKHRLARADFEDLIGARVEATVRLTGELVRAAADAGCAVETLVLIGGSARIPLIQRRLAEALPVEPRPYGEADVAVALGAAYQAAQHWGPRPVPPDDDRSERLARYREAVTEAWSDQRLDPDALTHLDRLVAELGLDSDQAAAIEHEVIGETREAVAARQHEKQQRRTPPAPMRKAVPRAVDMHGKPAAFVQKRQRQTAEALGLPVAFRHPLRDGGEGPELLVIPAGRFLMGSPDDEAQRVNDEGPQHQVRLPAPFAIGRYAVTFAEYDGFCTSTGRDRPDASGWGRGRQPVINVSWHDAAAYCGWLREQTGRAYRLPSEAEWEYTARAGTTGPFWWGERIDTDRANYDGTYNYAGGPRGEYRRRTLPVDAFEPNPFGLYQVHGNVWEWCQDNEHGSYRGAPEDGSAWETGQGGSRLLRGGSWHWYPSFCRAAHRGFGSAGAANTRRGFRVCCSIPIEPLDSEH